MDFSEWPPGFLKKVFIVQPVAFNVYINYDHQEVIKMKRNFHIISCLLYTSDAADESSSV